MTGQADVPVPAGLPLPGAPRPREGEAAAPHHRKSSPSSRGPAEDDSGGTQRYIKDF